MPDGSPMVMQMGASGAMGSAAGGGLRMFQRPILGGFDIGHAPEIAQIPAAIYGHLIFVELLLDVVVARHAKHFQLGRRLVASNDQLDADGRLIGLCWFAYM